MPPSWLPLTSGWPLVAWPTMTNNLKLVEGSNQQSQPLPTQVPIFAPSKLPFLPPFHIFGHFLSTLLHWLQHLPNLPKLLLTPKSLETIFKPFLKFGQATVKAIFIKNSWIKLWTCGLELASRLTKFYKILVFGLVLMFQNTFFFSIRAAKKLLIIKFF
jgi:hypothetical protein